MPVEVRFSAAELRLADQQGYDRGHAAGLAEAEASRAAFETMTLAAIAGAMTGARDTLGAVAEAAAGALARTVIAAMDAVMPALIARTAVDEIDAMLAGVLPGLAREPDIRVMVAPEISDAVGARLNRLSREDRARITVAGEGGMAAGAARISWAAGHAERQPGQVWQQVMAVFRLPSGDTATKEIRDDE